ncbi:MAG: RNA methyltransferase [Lachnospiraceae bacterium]|nr:RNA methyltransferase [Lachnospiraceae bacterium]
MITSLANEKIKHMVQLREKAKLRAEEGVFLVEGVRLFREVHPEDVLECYVTERGAVLLGKVPDGAETVSENVMQKMSDVKTPQGVLAVVRRRKYRREELLAGNAPLLILAEDLQDPGNLGTLFRTAEAAGADGIILNAGCADVYQPKVVRATMGAVLRMPFIIEENITDCFAVLARKGITVYAAALTQRAVFYTEADYTGGSAFLIGNEGNGLKRQTLLAAQQQGQEVIIPMAGSTESLNASVSAAVLLYEAARQRGFGKAGERIKRERIKRERMKQQ